MCVSAGSVSKATTADRETVLASLQPALASLCNRFRVPGMDRDDLLQESSVAVWRSLPDFDATRSSLKTFAVMVARARLITLHKQQLNNKNLAVSEGVSLDAPTGSDEEGVSSAYISRFRQNREADAALAAERREGFLAVKAALVDLLTEREHEVLELYLKNLSYAEMVAILKKTNPKLSDARLTRRVDNAVQRIRGKARLLA